MTAPSLALRLFSNCGVGTPAAHLRWTLILMLTRSAQLHNHLTSAGTIFGPAPGEPTAPASGGGVGTAGSSFGAPSAGAFPQLAAAMAPPPPDAAQGGPGAGPGAGAAPPPPPPVLGAGALCSALVRKTCKASQSLSRVRLGHMWVSGMFIGTSLSGNIFSSPAEFQLANGNI